MENDCYKEFSTEHRAVRILHNTEHQYIADPMRLSARLRADDINTGRILQQCVFRGHFKEYRRLGKSSNPSATHQNKLFCASVGLCCERTRFRACHLSTSEWLVL